MAGNKTFVHVTHEAAGKIGGIGAVLEGLLTSHTYLDSVERSILVGPLFNFEGPVQNRFGEDFEALYSSRDGLAKTQYTHAFRQIEKEFNAAIIYGKRSFCNHHTGILNHRQANEDRRPEILLIDVRIMNKEPVNKFKHELFERFGIRSDLYENIWEFEEYIRLAPVAIAALHAIGAANDAVIIAHEFMGMPTALAAKLEKGRSYQTIFYAHEVATIRKIVESNSAHDTMFYNMMKYCQENKFYINEVFGDQNDFFKHPLVEASRYCDYIFVVGDYVGEELRFLSPEFETANIHIVYNGIPACKISGEEKLVSKSKLQQYCENLLGFRPDFVFTHVARLVKSKGLWRDLQVLHNLEKKFQRDNKSAVLFLLSTETSKRPGALVCEMESKYNWPVAHRESWPDLSGGEADLYTLIQKFNAQSRNIKVVFINQFGFSRHCCGNRMPADLRFADIRMGTDVEFGMSIYEPFGIAQLEALTFGGICVISSVCGCAGFVRDVMNGQKNPNVIIADYVDLRRCGCDSIENLVQIDKTVLDMIEYCEGQRIANSLYQRLTTDYDIEKMVQNGFEIAKNMSWDVVVQNYLLAALQKQSSVKNQTHTFNTV
jgi:glycosyltransferase involved in cell wall biosynthesis